MSNNITQVEVVNGASLPDVGSDNFTLYGVNNGNGASGKVEMDRVASSLLASNHAFSQVVKETSSTTIDLSVCDAVAGNGSVFVNDLNKQVTAIRLGTGMKNIVKRYAVMFRTGDSVSFDTRECSIYRVDGTSLSNITCWMEVVVFGNVYILNIMQAKDR